MKRIAPGYYSEAATINFDGKGYEVEIFVQKGDHGLWYSTVEGGPDFIDAADLYETKRGAVEGVEYMKLVGFRYVSGLGWCNGEPKDPEVIARLKEMGWI